MDFNKSFRYDPQPDWVLETSTDDTDKTYYVDQFKSIKAELNSVKDELSNFDLADWSSHTLSTNPASQVVKHVIQTIKPQPLCTNAWCKFNELISVLRLLDDLDLEGRFDSVHLCEAPGGFICALNHYFRQNRFQGTHRWMANTLNPYHERNTLLSMIPDDRLIRLSLDNWLYGCDNTGDITSYDNITSIVAECQARLNNIQLVTADGSIDCQLNPGEQESMVYPLILREVFTAALLFHKPNTDLPSTTMSAPTACTWELQGSAASQEHQEGVDSQIEHGGTTSQTEKGGIGSQAEKEGVAVFKFFTMYETETVSLMYLLNLLFEKVKVHKPVTSKPGNSEVYVVCRYRASNPSRQLALIDLLKQHCLTEISAPVIPLDRIPLSFLQQHQICVQLFSHYQSRTIENNIASFTPGAVKGFHDYSLLSKQFVKKLQLKPIKYSGNMAAAVGFHQNISRSILITETWQGRKRRLSGTLQQRAEKYTGADNSDEILEKLSIQSEDFLGCTIKCLCPSNQSPLDVIKFIRPVFSSSSISCFKVTNSVFCDSHLLKRYNSLVDLNRNKPFASPLAALHGDPSEPEPLQSSNVEQARDVNMKQAPGEPVRQSADRLELKYRTITLTGPRDYEDVVQALSILTDVKFGDSLIVVKSSPIYRLQSSFLFLLWHLFDEVVVTDEPPEVFHPLRFKRCIVPEMAELVSNITRDLFGLAHQLRCHSPHLVELVPTPIVTSCSPFYKFTRELNNLNLVKLANDLIDTLKIDSTL